ncbi:MAG: aldo/keto reductase [Microthrixaceae bacterium]
MVEDVHPLRLPEMGVGCWAWGDRATWGVGGYDTATTEATIAEAFEASLDAGVTLFDTAEVYGDGESERILGRLIAANPGVRDRLVVATQFLPLPQKLDVVRATREALEASLGRLGLDRVDLYQLHGPIHLSRPGSRADALAAVVEAGLAGAVGVSNYSAGETRAIHRELAARGVALATNQIECSLLRSRPITQGLLGTCRSLGVTPLAYSPLGQGRLTGKYTVADPPPGRRRFSAHPMASVEKAVSVLREVGDAHDRTPGQTALRWLIHHGLVPIPGAKNAKQAAQNAGALGWELGAAELRTLDEAALLGKETPLNRLFWQHG